QSKSATATTTLVEPNVKVKKSHVGGKIVKPGQIVEWTVTAENPSGTRVSAANDSTVVDSVPLGMTPVNGSTPVEDGKTVEPDGGTWNEEKRTITWSIPLLNPGGTKALHYSLKVNEPANAGSIFKNSATLKTTSLPGDVTGERTASSASHTGYEAKAEDEATLNDAELEKSVAAPKGTTIGSPLTYTLKLKLPPNINFFDTTVEDQLPKGVAFDGTASVKCEPGCDPVAEGAITLNPKTVGGAQLLGWFFGDVSSAPSERVVTITYNAHIAQELEAGVKVKDKDKLQNKAIGLYSGADKFTEPPTEPPARAEYTNKTNEPSAQIEVTEPKLTIDKAVTGEVAPPSNTQPGDKYTYTLTVTNSGDSPAYDITVKDNNPQGVLRNVQPKGSVSGELEGEDLLAPGWSTGDPLEWDIPGGIAPGASVKLQYKGELAPSAELSDGDTIINVADIPSYFGAPETQRNEEGPSRFREYTEDPEDTVTLETSLPKPKVEKTVGTGGAEEATAEISKPFVWQVKVTNQATAATWKGVDLLDTLPKGWEYVAGSAEMPVGTTLEDPGGVGSVNGAGEEELSWTDLADLAPGASFTVTFKAVPTLALALLPGQYTNEAKASGEDTAGATASEAGPYEAEDSAKANLITPGLEIKKTPDDGPAVAGQPSAYDIEIHNGGGAVATSVEVSDLLGAGNEYSAGSATATPPTGFSETSVEAVGAGETRVKWAIASIAAGGTVTIHVPVSLSPSIEDNTRLVDHANVKSAEETTPVEDEGSLIVKRKVDVEITKEQSKATPNAGEPETYTLHVKNNGPSDAKGVVVTDPVPTGTELLGVPSGCEESPAGTVKCAIGDLALDATRDFTIETRVLPSATGTIVNKANVTSTTEDTEPDNNEAEVEATVEHLANVVIQKSGPEAPVLLGSTFTYTLEVENKGPSDAENVEVDDALPGEVEALAVDTDTGSCEPPSATVECALGTMVPGAKAVIHVTVKAIGMPSDPEGVVNVGKATSTTPDPETPNESEAKTKVEPAADLAITKTAPATVPADGELTYSLHVENFGPSDGTEVAISDPLPAGTQFVSASEGCTQAGGTVTCVLGELKVGDTHDYQVTVKVPLASADKDLVNTATVKGHEADPETENNSSTVTTKTGPAADLEIRKTMGAAEAGQPLSYTLAVTNHGPSRSSAVTVHDTLPAGVSFKSAQASQGSCSASGSTVTCNLGGLDSGASAQVTITVDVAADASGSLRNKATVEGPEPDPNKQNNESTVEGPIKPAPKKDEGKPNEGKPNLHLVKTADDSSPKVGDPIHYRVTVSNRGTAAAKNVRVTDTMNGPAKVVSIDTDKGSCENKGDGKITCLIPDLAPGQAAHILVTVVAKDAGELRNVASAEAGNGEMAVADNRAVKDVTASGGRGSFALTKTASRKVVPGGKKVSFAIRLRVGREALTDVTVCDRLPKGLVFVKAPGASFDRGRACWQRDFVAAHKVLKLRLVARAVRGYKSMRAKNVASADAGNARRRAAAATVRIKPAFGGKPGGVTG
ncbi:MAG TPA: hypothetical protein VEB65_10445, partial [Solirubrobacterales bacterium]|nr:hypothetical protein [Solirubrobacterales bacterium]